MSSPRLLLQEGGAPEVPPHSLAERLAGLTARGWDARLVNGHPLGRTARARAGARIATLGNGGPPIVHFASGPAAVRGIAAARRAGAAALVTLSGEDLAAGGLAEPGYYDDVWRHAAAIHLSDDHVWPRALARGCPESVAHAVIGPASDTSYFVPQNGELSDGPLRLLIVAPLRWSQGHEHALHAVRLLLDRGVECRLRIVGAGAYAEAVAFARHQLGLEAQVELISQASAADLRAEYARADVFVCAAVVQGTPRALLDAQAMALPAVVSDAGRQPEFMDGSGLVVARRDPHALAEALERLAADTALRREMGRRARERAEAAPLDEHVAAFDELYRALA